MTSALQPSAQLLDTPPPSAQPFTDELWACVEREKAIHGLQNLVRAIKRYHRRGLELRGVNRQDLALDAASGTLYLVAAPRCRAVEDRSMSGLAAESIWRDGRLVGELAYENFMGETYPGGHQMAALLQDRATMAEIGLLHPGLPQLVATCVSPYGELAMLDINDLSDALEQLRREVLRKFTYRVGARSTVGNYVFRRNNQDSCAYVLMESSLGSMTQSVGFFCVADGIGGIHDGERASALAAQSACRAFGRAMAHYGGEEIARRPGDFARAIVHITSQRLALEGEFAPEKNRGGTTFTCLILAGNRAGVGHAGDSRAVLIRDGALLAITRDHTLASIFKELGEPPTNPEQADTNSRTISRFLSTSMELEPSRVDGISPAFATSLSDAPVDLTQMNHIGFEVRPNDLFLLTSDGVHDELSAECLGQLVAMHATAPQKLVDALINQALRQVGRDNATAMAIRVE